MLLLHPETPDSVQSTNTMDLKFKKRPGTAGIGGHLYETKLISLILFRLLHDDTIEDFYLGSNLADIGAFDDICLKIKIAGRDRPVVVFVQVKHKDNDDKCLSLGNKSDAAKWFDSITQIKKRIKASNNVHQIFRDDIDELDYVFILYTNAKCDFVSEIKFESNYATNINNLIATRDSVGLHPLYTEKHINVISETILETHMSCLAEQFAKFLSCKDNQSMNIIMNNEYVQMYHLFLKKYVVNIYDIQTDEQKPELKWRIMTFRDDFFDNDDKYLLIFRNHFYEQIFKNPLKELIQRPTSNMLLEQQIYSFFVEPSAETLSALIITHITCNTSGKLVFVSERSEYDMKRLREINLPMIEINQAKAISIKRKLLWLELKVPCAFGNIDLAINGSQKKNERRLNHLTNSIVNLCQNYTETDCYKVVNIDDTIDAGILRSNGGLASAVGNLLVYDDKRNLLKFSTDDATLHDNSKALYSNLKSKINNLHEYRFDVKTSKFPKLSFDCTDIAKEVLDKLVIYSNQSNHYEVDEILQKEIQNQLSKTPNRLSGKFELIRLCFHNEIQKWWMSAETGSYFTKTSDIYEQTINSVEAESQICKLQNMFHVYNIRYLDFNFSQNAMDSFKFLKKKLKIAIITDITTLTVVKVIKCIENNNSIPEYVVLYMETIQNLHDVDFSALEAELRKTKNIIIIIYDNTECHKISHHKLLELAEATRDKQVIIITNVVFIEEVKTIFGYPYVVDDKSQSFIDLTPETQRVIANNSKVIFQGFEVRLNLFVDDKSIVFIKGAILKKIIQNEIITIGLPLSDSSYDEIKYLYVDRTISLVRSSITKDFDDDDYSYEIKSRTVRTFNDISDDAVLITAAPGMGKSTLLTHLAIASKEHNQNLWIVRMNLLDYSKQFYKWQEVNTVLDTVGTLKFIMHHVLLKNNVLRINLKETDNKISLEGCTGDEWTTFELKMFLRFYNKRKLILLFDGFDEICPHYKNSVIMFLNAVRNFPQKNKMWVTSRPYSDILPDLTRNFGKYYKINHLSVVEQKTYLNNTWQAKWDVHELNQEQLKNLKMFLTVMRNTGNNIQGPMKAYFYNIIIRYFTSYIDAYFPFRSDTKFRHLTQDQPNFLTRFTEEGNSLEKHCIFSFTHICHNYMGKDPRELLGTPLLLNLTAEYLMNMVHTSKYDLSMNMCNLYKTIIESKLKNILFRDKNKMDVFNPDIITKYKTELNDCMTMHKKLAAYYLLAKSLKKFGMVLHALKEINPFNKEECNPLIYKIKVGQEKTGLISHITANDEPVFIHRTFSEYFAAEFLCDILVSDKFKPNFKEEVINSLYELHHDDLVPWIAEKSLIDQNLRDKIDQIVNRTLRIQHLYVRQFV